MTLVSRVTGLLRDMATSHVLGDTFVNDALTLAWTVPNLFRRMFGEGALGSAFLSVFSRVLTTEGRKRAAQVSNAVISAVAVSLVGLVVVLIAATYLIPESFSVWVLGPEHASKVELTLHYTRMLLPYMAAICIIAQFMAVLNSVGEFAVPAFSPIILNVVWLMGIGAAAWWGSSSGGSLADQGTIIAASILVAAVAQILWHLPAMRSRGLAFRPHWPRKTPEVSQVALIMGPMLLGMGSAQLNILADRTIAMRSLGEGGVSHLYYGLRLMQFPLGLVSVALVTAVFPALTKLMAGGDRRGATDTTSFALRTNLLISVPAAIGLMVLAHPIIELLFQSGRFGASSTEATSRALIGYALGVPFVGSVMLLTRASYAMGDVRFPMRIGLITTGINVALDLLLVGPLQDFGLAVATSMTAMVSTLLLALGVRRRLELRPAEKLMTGIPPTIILAVVLAASIWGVDFAIAGRLAEGRIDALIRVLVGLSTGLGVFVLLARQLFPREWGELSGLLRRSRRSE
jgi:putative peptidoglycan lipid II flippase